MHRFPNHCPKCNGSMSDPTRKRTLADSYDSELEAADQGLVYSSLLQQVDDELSPPRRARIEPVSTVAIVPSLPERRREPSEESSDRTNACGMCLTSVDERGVLNVCDHLFCFQCITRWARTENTCPICRKRFESIRIAGESREKSTTSVVTKRNQPPQLIPSFTRTQQRELESEQRRTQSTTRVYLELKRVPNLRRDDPRLAQLPLYLVNTLFRTNPSSIVVKKEQPAITNEPSTAVAQTSSTVQRVMIAGGVEPVVSADGATTTRTRTYLDLDADEDNPRLVTGVWETVTTTRTRIVLDLTKDSDDE